MKFCPECGAKVIDNGAKFCAKCGNERKGTEKFCSQCGAKYDSLQKPIADEQERTTIGLKKYLPYIIGAIILVCMIGYFISKKNSDNNNDSHSVFVDSLEIEEAKAKKSSTKVSNVIFSGNSFVGKVYKGSGNGGGNGIDMTITFINEKECLCLSDWYRAYSSYKEIRCPYDVKDNHVIIHVNDDGTKYDLDFQIEKGGKKISFDNSDESIGGTMGYDFLTLELAEGDNKAMGKNESDESDNRNRSYSSSRTSSSSSRTFANEQYVTMYLANQSFRDRDGLTIRFDGSLRIYIDGDYAGVVSVMRYNSTSALLRYGGGLYGEGKITLQIVGDKLQLTDPLDGTVYYQR